MKFWTPLFWAYAVAIAAVLVSAWIVFRDSEAALYVVSSTEEAARDSLLSCGNVALPSRRQAETYSSQRPGTHVYAVRIR